MTSPASIHAEIELKLALPGADPRRVAAQLAELPELASLRVTEQRLRNIYFDTPDQHLRQQQAALRVRSVRQGTGRARWVQTFKNAGPAIGALSQRGEWEAAVRGAALDPMALQATPWPRLDRDGSLLAQLAPCFETDAVRTLRLYSGADGSHIEVVLDVGKINAGAESAEVCELELELLKGVPAALFDLAERIAAQVAVLPSATSKAERGWRLIDGTHSAPRRARKIELSRELPVALAAQTVLAEMLEQFTENLCGLLQSEGPELVHQARVGWRRWRSALWLFKPLLKEYPAPDTAGLRPLLNALGAMRDFDVAALESLPQWAQAYVEGDAERAAEWQAMETAVSAERMMRRARLLSVLESPGTGVALLNLGRWLHGLPQGAAAADGADQSIAEWAATRTKRLHGRLSDEVDRMEADDPDTDADEALEHQHEVRLLAKRTRYVLESLRSVLPKARTRRWQEQATELQTRIGAARDLMLLASLLEPLGVDRAVLGFLRGVAAGRAAGD